ncbi:hypothetical protein BT63DRAFT_174559 [Microthyrium microscopicum]|uniref:Uncharacterized protein n=1 Tax=Microthyrium microscopicum TaxID=703497 RepID=A0A6A6UIH8_9PEZI|nr:hypothetical protein BT63DRAFT_174559 [Microthyrium microscopicum]
MSYNNPNGYYYGDPRYNQAPPPQQLPPQQSQHQYNQYDDTPYQYSPSYNQNAQYTQQPQSAQNYPAHTQQQYQQTQIPEQQYAQYYNAPETQSLTEQLLQAAVQSSPQQTYHTANNLNGLAASGYGSSVAGTGSDGFYNSWSQPNGAGTTHASPQISTAGTMYAQPGTTAPTLTQLPPSSPLPPTNPYLQGNTATHSPLSLGNLLQPQISAPSSSQSLPIAQPSLSQYGPPSFPQSRDPRQRQGLQPQAMSQLYSPPSSASNVNQTAASPQVTYSGREGQPAMHKPQKSRPQSLPKLPVVKISSSSSLDLKPSSQERPKSAISQRVAVPTPTEAGADRLQYDQLLISLSEEYVNAAYALGPQVALMADPEAVEIYNGLMAAGLGCLEAALKKFNFPARLKAAITYRYACLLFEETENYEQLEHILSQSISHCDLNKLFDFKYAIYHLHARATFRRNPKAAIKALDARIREVEGFKNVPWTYALRLLRVTLSMQISSHHEIIAALQNLKALIAMTEKRGDDALTIAFSVFEALIHLRSDSVDFSMNCQESIARARSLQMRKSTQGVKQLWAILNCVDQACSLMLSQTEQAKAKTSLSEDLFQQLILEEEVWQPDGSIEVPLSASSAAQLSDLSPQIFSKSSDGETFLSLGWLDSSGAYALSLMFSACAKILGNAKDAEAPALIHKAIELLDSTLDPTQQTEDNGIFPTSRVDMQTRFAGNRMIMWYLVLYQSFLHATNTHWTDARRGLKKLNSLLQGDESSRSQNLRYWTLYLQGVVEQGTGNTEAAIQTFQSLLSMSPAKSTPNKRQGVVYDDLGILARLNLILLLRSPNHPPTPQAEQLQAEVKSLVTAEHPNQLIVASMQFVLAIWNSNESISRTKAGLKEALGPARVLNSAQLLAITMNALLTMFFKDITTGHQQENGRKVVVQLAKNSMDPLWISVANGLALDGPADPQKRELQERELDTYMDQLAPNVRNRFLVEEEDVMETT